MAREMRAQRTDELTPLALSTHTQSRTLLLRVCGCAIQEPMLRVPKIGPTMDNLVTPNVAFGQ